MPLDPVARSWQALPMTPTGILETILYARDLEAIEAATANGPETLGPQAPHTGQLVAGFDADVITLDDDGLPIGVQLVAAYGREDLLIAVASQLESAHPWAHRRPPE